MDLGLENLSVVILGDDEEVIHACSEALTGEGTKVTSGRDGLQTADILVITLKPGPGVGLGDVDGDASVLTDAWDKVALLCTDIQSALRGMAQRGFGRIIFVGPSAAKTLEDNAITDRISALGMLGLQKNLAGEFGEHGITANSVLYDRKVAPRDALMTAIGAACAYLASRQAAYLTGVVMTVDAGQSRSVF